MAYLQSRLNTALIPHALGRDERLELPEGALREALVNAIVHRDYRSTANVQVHVFRDRLEIVTPGGLPAGMREEDLGTKSVPRNPLLFGMFYRMGLVEQIGSGIRRIRELCLDYGVAEPIIDVSENWVTTTFARQVEHAVSQVPDKYPASQKSHPFTGRRADTSGNPSDSGTQGSDEFGQGIHTTGSCRRFHRDDHPGQPPQQQTEVSTDGQGAEIAGAHESDAMSLLQFHLVPSYGPCFALGPDASIFPEALTPVSGTRAASPTLGQSRAGSRSALIVPLKAGNRGHRDPPEGSGASSVQTH